MNMNSYTYKEIAVEQEQRDFISKLPGVASQAQVILDEIKKLETYASGNCSDCGSAFQCCCFLAGSPVTMADGTTKKIEDVRVGDYVRGAGGEANLVIGLARPLLSNRPMVSINDTHITTTAHPVLKSNRTWGVFDVQRYWNEENSTTQEIIVDNEGTVEPWILPGLDAADAHLMTPLEIGDNVVTVDGDVEVADMTIINLDPSTQLYNLAVAGSHTYFVNGYAVSGFLNSLDFDITTWKHIAEPYSVDDYRYGRKVKSTN